MGEQRLPLPLARDEQVVADRRTASRAEDFVREVGNGREARHAGLAGALETMLDNIQVRTRMAKAARAKVERHFALSRNVSYLAGLFANATADSTITT